MIEIFEPGSSDYHVCQERHEVSAAKAATLLKPQSRQSGSAASQLGVTRETERADQPADRPGSEMPSAMRTRD